MHSISFLYFIEQCGKCRANTRKLNLNKYCKRDYGKSLQYVWNAIKSSLLLVRILLLIESNEFCLLCI
jgi:hypothetical protein